MGMSYAELGDLGVLRKSELCGPITAFEKLRVSRRKQDGTHVRHSVASLSGISSRKSETRLERACVFDCPLSTFVIVFFFLRLQ